MLKVVHVVEALAGGVNTYFKDLSCYFGAEQTALGINTTIIYSANRKEVDGAQIKASFSNTVPLIELSMQREFSLIKDLKATRELLKLVRKLDPDVVHLHSSKAGVLGRIACFFLFKKVKVFYTPHGYAFLRTDISAFKKVTYRAIELVFQKLFKNTTIACGDAEYTIAKKMGPSYLVRNGINVDEIQTHCTALTNSVLTIGIVGRITAARNPELFNQIALENPQYQFVWIGDGELRPTLTATNIRISGWFLNHPNVLRELDKIDVYIQTSLWEGLPIAVLEAMAMQKPVIATNIPGNRDVVVPNEGGFLFDSIAEVKDYLDLLKDKNTRAQMGKNGHVRCQKLFSNDRKFKELVALYRQ
ncbi:glycosyltransferase [Flavobacterium sp.]|uniref:glycosyltransferase n=1 Tax=Flavobacterium sp. TaxID=239 RepID=UPI00263A2F68|nr:glycosyltransferase [Flavobacterium sp.]MDG2433121.1 glycosyltransferase [Flavobacterium sp.]